MRIDGISYNPEWAKQKTEREFVEQHINAFNGSTHPVSKMKKREQLRYFKQAYQIITGGTTSGDDQSNDTEV